jgi:hypothetical protein
MGSIIAQTQAGRIRLRVSRNFERGARGYGWRNTPKRLRKSARETRDPTREQCALSFGLARGYPCFSRAAATTPPASRDNQETRVAISAPSVVAGYSLNCELAPRQAVCMNARQLEIVMRIQRAALLLFVAVVASACAAVDLWRGQNSHAGQASSVLEIRDGGQCLEWTDWTQICTRPEIDDGRTLGNSVCRRLPSASSVTAHDAPVCLRWQGPVTRNISLYALGSGNTRYCNSWDDGVQSCTRQSGRVQCERIHGAEGPPRMSLCTQWVTPHPFDGMRLSEIDDPNCLRWGNHDQVCSRGMTVGSVVSNALKRMQCLVPTRVRHGERRIAVKFGQMAHMIGTVRVV